jgi:beta-glucosidase
VPLLQLQGFTRLHLSAGEKRNVEFSISAEQMSFADEMGQWILEPGDFKVWVGGQQPDLKQAVQQANVLETKFTVRAD